MTLKQLQKLCHKIAVEKGFWKQCKWCKGDKKCDCGVCDNRGYLLDRNNAEMIALMHSELSEALEAMRTGNPQSKKIPKFSLAEEEFADCIIRILDMAEGRELNIEGALKAKIKYNKTRPFKHNKEF